MMNSVARLPAIRRAKVRWWMMSLLTTPALSWAVPASMAFPTAMLRIAPASVKKLKAKVRLMTRRTRLTPLREVIAELIPVIRGWTNYFRLAAINRLCQELDEWTRRKLRCLRLKQCKHPRGIRRFFESIGCKRKLWSGIVAMGCRWWRIACSQPANISMDNARLRAEGYISFNQLLKRWLETAVCHKWHVRWCERGGESPLLD